MADQATPADTSAPSQNGNAPEIDTPSNTASTPVPHRGRQPFASIGQQRASAAIDARRLEEQQRAQKSAEETAEARRQAGLFPTRLPPINRFANTRRNTSGTRPQPPLVSPPPPPPSVVNNANGGVNNANSVASNTSDAAESIDTTQRMAKGANQVSGNENTNSVEPNENENQTSIQPQPDEDPEETEEPVRATASGDPALPHILKLGQGSFAEYITLKQVPIGTEGDFNALQTGSKEIELQRKYGVQTNEQIAAMQRAFGVRNQHQTPPIIGFIERGCIPKGFELVQVALETRLDTLDTNIDLIRNSMASSPMKQRQRWIRDILEKTSTLTESCENEEPNTTIPTAKTNAPKPTASSGCPCLDELSLLRNLTYIISFLTGTTDPAIKKQLEQITLTRMLKAARNGNTNQASTILQEILSAIESYIKTSAQTNIPTEDERTQSILEPIYTALVKIYDKSNNVVMVPKVITLDMIMQELQKIVKILEVAQKRTTECETIQSRVNALEAELKQEKAKGSSATTSASDAQQQITALQAALETFAQSLQQAQTQLAEAQGGVSAAREELQARTGELTAELATLRRTLSEHETNIRTRDDTIRTLEGDIEDGKEQTESLKEIIKTLTEQQKRRDAAYRGAVADIQRRIGEKDVEITTLREQLAAATAEFAEKTGQADVVSGHFQTLTESLTRAEEEVKKIQGEKSVLETTNDELSMGIEDLQRRIVACHAALEASHGKGGRDEEKIAELERAIEELRRQLETKQREKSAADAELVGLKSRIEANGAQIRGLEAQIATLTAEKAQGAAELVAEKQKVAEFEITKAQYEKEKAALQGQLGELQTFAGNLRAELATATADGQSSKSDKETLEKELATAMAKIASLEASLEQITSRSAASQIQVDEAHKAQLAALQSELDTTKAEVEHVKRIAQEEKEALIRAQEDEIAGKKTEIESLQTQLQSAIQTSAEKGTIEAQLATKTAELEAAGSALADLRSELANRPTQNNVNQRNAKLAEKNALLEQKEARIKELEEKLAESNQKYTDMSGEFDTLTGEKDTLVSSLSVAQEEMDAKESKLAELQKELEGVKSIVESQTIALAEAQGASGITKERLNALLGHLIINPELQQTAHAFLNGDDTALEPLQRDVCELYQYLGSVLNLQIRKLDSSGLPKEAKQDIFSIFKSMPAYDDTKLLSELNSVFQELFIQVAQTSTIPDTILLKRNYPELTATLGGYALEGGLPLKLEGRELDKFIIELNTFGYLSSISVEPRPDSHVALLKKGFTISSDFATRNVAHTTPLVILGIKMIQLMAKILKLKYKEVAKRCGAPIGVETVSRNASPAPHGNPEVEHDPVAAAKREFDMAVKQLTSAVLVQHINKYTELLLNPKSAEGEQARHFPKRLAYAVLLSEYAHTLTRENPRVSLKTMIESRADILDAAIKKVEIQGNPEYIGIIRRVRGNATGV
jgi:predicted  nucleic acid-binding Zn-ribbon protein